VRASLLSAAVTLPIGWILALILNLSIDDRPDRYLADQFAPNVGLILLLTAPVALLMAWGEIDLSALGLIPLGGALYIEAGGETVAGGLFVAGVVGLGFGLALGVARWLSRAPSALLSLGAGYIAVGVAFRLSEKGTPVEATITGSGLVIALALMVLVATVALALLVASLEPSPDQTTAATTAPGWRVIPGFALSGLAGGLTGAATIEGMGSYEHFLGTNALLSLFLAIAVAGVAVRGNSVVAPLAVAVAVPAVVLIRDTEFYEWRVGNDYLVLGGLIVGGAIVAHTIHRLLAPSTTPAPAAPAAAGSSMAGEPS
jgi:hypothetical protein